MDSQPSTSRLRAVLQLVEIKEFAERIGLPYEDNEVIYRWISEGHADKFSTHFDEHHREIIRQCHRKCHAECHGDVNHCPLKKKLHRLLKDKGDW